MGEVIARILAWFSIQSNILVDYILDDRWTYSCSLLDQKSQRDVPFLGQWHPIDDSFCISLAILSAIVSFKITPVLLDSEVYLRYPKQITDYYPLRICS